MRKITVVMLTVMAGMLAAHPVQGGIAYLPSIGPAPMRFEVTTNSDESLAWKSLCPLLPAVESSNVPVPEVTALNPDTNDVVIKVSSAPVTNALASASVSAAKPGENKNSETSPGTVMLPVQTDESSNPIIPQLLAGFFKPTPAGKKPGGRNPAGAAVFMPAEIGFTPPSSTPVPVSQASYKTE